MENNEKNTGSEALNSAILFEELELIIKEYLVKNKYKKMPEIYFYVLTDTEIDYNFYNKEFENVIEKILESIKNEKEKVLKNEKIEEEIQEIQKILKRQLVPNVINEAILSGKSLFRKKNFYDSRHEFNKKTHRTFILGFGQTGEESMKQLYISNAYVDENDKSTQFIAEVFDKDVDNIMGIFEQNHPLFICTKDDEKGIEFVNLNDSEKVNYDKINKFYQNIVTEYKTTGCEEIIKDIDEKMAFPIVNFHNVSCLSDKCITFISSALKSDENEVDSIIITLGNDELNIKMTNLLITQIKHNIDGEKSKPLTIYVNLRDKNNNRRIDWSQTRKTNENLKVIIFGNSTEIYSYKTIIDHSEAIKYNNSYNAIGNNIYRSINNEEVIIGYYDCTTKKFEYVSSENIEKTTTLKEKAQKFKFEKRKEIELQNDKKIKTYYIALNNKEYLNLVGTTFHKINSKDESTEWCLTPTNDLGYIMDNKDIKNIYKNGNSNYYIFNANNINVEYAVLLKYLFKNVDNIEESLDFVKNYNNIIPADDNWNTLSLIKRESNESAYLFCESFKKEKLSPNEIVYLSKIEKNRWNRFYICQGYVPGIVKDESKKEHDCLISYKYLKDDVKPYDAINVILGCYKNKKGEKNNG